MYGVATTTADGVWEDQHPPGVLKLAAVRNQERVGDLGRNGPVRIRAL
jgi:hypothetical protein